MIKLVERRSRRVPIGPQRRRITNEQTRML